MNEDEILKICDFGLAHDLRNGNIMSFRGTPNFSAPEVYKSEGFGKSVSRGFLYFFRFLILMGQINLIRKENTKKVNFSSNISCLVYCLFFNL